jgi:hypothetical protein
MESPRTAVHLLLIMLVALTGVAQESASQSVTVTFSSL